MVWPLPRAPPSHIWSAKGRLHVSLLVQPAALGPLTSPHQAESESGAKTRRHHHLQEAPLFLPPMESRVPASAKPHCSQRLLLLGLGWTQPLTSLIHAPCWPWAPWLRALAQWPLWPHPLMSLPLCLAWGEVLLPCSHT